MLISIIIATYNCEKYIDSFFNNFIPLKSNDIELLIIDGSSVDSTVSLISNYLDFIDVFVSEKDNGIYDAWNKGLSFCKGDWIMFLGIDDVLYPETITNYKKIINNDIDYICGINEFVNLNNIPIKSFGKSAEWNNLKYYMSPAHVGSLHNKKLFSEIGYFNSKYKICGDYELLIRKRNKLNHLFIQSKVAKMKVGGISFSLNAIIESFLIRKKYKTINLILNLFLLIFNIFLLFKFKYFNFYRYYK